MLILGEQIPLKQNLLASLHQHRYLWLLLFAVGFLDFVTTVVFMSQYGIRFEGNPVVRWLAFNIGIFPGVILGKLLQVLAAFGLSALSSRLARATLLLIVLLNLVAIAMNLR